MQGSYYQEQRQADLEYGQAVKYIIDTYGLESINQLIETLREDKLQTSSSFNKDLLFKVAFSSAITDYDEFKLNYPVLVTE